ncbi:aldo/keto reductase [Sporosarcina thermotolerans]|uniref:Aldo/keto reductase n=1 Tax=Sporosarcina thermotolerans TaxID=633404 RepID=A0AAW9A4H1_9BACL|nr:aldo/keto reductase [Sporosarcina thermotolerans]MDW0115619.1 aldo/keto reductase [Sporosarcina thermotolerans]WHT47088.1 aldo/keto reductase [Sporosarcina thermotolerans]
MKKREIGKSGLYASELGLGCMSFPDDLDEVKNIVDAALHAGINFFDTADLYAGGKNEALVGEALKGRRDEIILATKVGNRMLPNEEGWRWDASKKYIKEAVKMSLKRLKTDYIDLYQLHGGTMEDNVTETIEAFEDLKKEGLIRQYGISSIRPNVIKRFLTSSSAVSVMMQYSLLDRRPEEWFPMIHEAGASVITRGTLAKGLLTDEGVARAEKMNSFAEYGPEDLKKTVRKVHESTNDVHASALSFNLNEDVVASALIGASSTDQLLDSILAYEKLVEQSEVDSITQLTESHQYVQHRP